MDETDRTLLRQLHWSRSIDPLQHTDVSLECEFLLGRRGDVSVPPVLETVEIVYMLGTLIMNSLPW